MSKYAAKFFLINKLPQKDLKSENFLFQNLFRKIVPSHTKRFPVLIFKSNYLSYKKIWAKDLYELVLQAKLVLEVTLYFLDGNLTYYKGIDRFL